MADTKHPQDHYDPHGTHPPRNFIKKLTEKADFGEDVDFVVGVTATALTADQLLKQASCKDHKVMHLAKAGITAAVAATAFTMMSREHKQHKRDERLQHQYHDHHHHKDRGRAYDSDSEDYNRRLRSSSRGTKRRMIGDGNNRPYREEDWAVVQSPHAPPRRSASVYERGYYNRNEDRNPDYYRNPDHYRASEDLPYPDDDRSVSPDPRSRGRVRSYSPPTHRDRDRSEPESKGGFKKFLEVVRDGIDKYDRYDHSRR